MRVDFLGVLLLETEQQLDRHDTSLSSLELEVRIQRHLSGVLVEMCLHLFSVDGLLGNTILVDTHCSQTVEDSRVNFGSTIGDDSDHDLLPALLTPHSRLVSRTQVGNVLHNSMHGSGKSHFVFVVHGNTDAQLCFSLVDSRS